MPLAAWERTAIGAVLWIEVALNLINGAVSILAPVQAVETMVTPGSLDNSDLGLEAVRWFGAMNLLVAWLLARTMFARHHLPLLLEALCIGDVIYLLSLTPCAYRLGRVPGIIPPYALTAIMFVARLRLLLAEDWARIDAAQESSRNSKRGS